MVEFPKVSLNEWESLVKKQLKTEDIYGILVKENLENVDVKTYYDQSDNIQKLPKIEESTHLIAPYSEFLEEDVYAFFTNENINVVEKSIFFSDKNLAQNLSIHDDNKYFCLTDVFNENGSVNETLAKELLDKNFERNIGIDITLHQNAGASIIQQLAIALVKTKDLIEIFGVEILNQVIFRFAIGHQYFLEIAKIRAFKYLFNQLSKEYNLNIFPYIYAETSFRNKANNDPENNLIRSTLELSAAMIGGADAVFTNDYKMQNQTKLSEEISFKQMIVLAYESIINVFEDATSGSYLIEDLTKQFAEKAWDLFLDLENKGGYYANILSGNLQKMIFDQAIKEQNWVEEGKIKLIGVNLYPKLDVKKQVSDLYKNDEIKAVRWAEMFE